MSSDDFGALLLLPAIFIAAAFVVLALALLGF